MEIWFKSNSDWLEIPSYVVSWNINAEGVATYSWKWESLLKEGALTMWLERSGAFWQMKTEIEEVL